MKEVKFCKYCGHKFGPNARFCGVCGKEIVRPQTVTNEEYTERKNIQPEFGSTRGMFYVIDLFKRIFMSHNVPVITYLALNIIFIGLIFTLLFKGMSDNPTAGGVISCFAIAIGIYLISITVALSPLGEFVLRFQNQCKKIKEPRQISRIEPLFREVYAKAKLADKTLPDDIRLFIKKDPSAYAFATGRKTLCITEGLLYESDERIRAVLSHEFGHLSHKDTDLILLVVVGNFIFTAIITIIRLFIWFAEMLIAVGNIIGNGKMSDFLTTVICGTLTLIFINFTTWAWTQLGFFIVMRSNKTKEYRADEFAFNLGHGNALCEILAELHEEPPKGLFANLANSHPKNKERIARLQKLGATYEARF